MQVLDHLECLACISISGEPVKDQRNNMGCRSAEFNRCNGQAKCGAVLAD